jgi:triphosphoribosyl-dephospho-CoA synthase
MKYTAIAAVPGCITSVIADLAVEALLEELHLTPKPGLVDAANSGSHLDLNLMVMIDSALSLTGTFQEMAAAAREQEASQALRERLAAIGRYGEQQMLAVTCNVNTHKGAIWCIGLITAAVSIHATGSKTFTISEILATAGRIAAFDDRYAPEKPTNGDQVRHRYTVVSAREEAIMGYPTLRDTAVPAWRKYEGEPEDIRRLNVLLSLMAVVDDTCILHRKNMYILKVIQKKSRSIMEDGGLSAGNNWKHYLDLEKFITNHWVSPGGCADLLAATIFIHKISKHFKIN